MTLFNYVREQSGLDRLLGRADEDLVNAHPPGLGHGVDYGVRESLPAVAGDPLNELVEALLAPSPGHHRGALRCQRPYRSFSDAARGPGHNRDLPFNLSPMCITSLRVS